MKQFILFVVLFSSSFSMHGQNDFASGMQKGLSLWGEGDTAGAIAMFERISQAEATAWLPSYYAANVHIASSFTEKDASKRDEMLNQAKRHIETAHQRSAKNAEILTLEGLLYTAYVAADPGTYAMKYAPKIMELHDKALSIDGENPRALMNKVEFEMGTARFFNEDMTPYCERIQIILTKFDDYKSSVPFAPNYGKERLIQLVENCNS